MNGTRPGPTTVTPAIPITTAPARPTPAAVHSAHAGSSVWSGRPRSSSRAWAEMPTARKKASSVAPNRKKLSRGARLAPIRT